MPLGEPYAKRICRRDQAQDLLAILNVNVGPPSLCEWRSSLRSGNEHASIFEAMLPPTRGVMDLRPRENSPVRRNDTTFASKQEATRFRPTGTGDNPRDFCLSRAHDECWPRA